MPIQIILDCHSYFFALLSLKWRCAGLVSLVAAKCYSVVNNEDRI